MPQVNPDILIWARETSGLSVEVAAKKLGLSGPERLVELEAGKRAPSRRQLINMAGTYRRPLITFYLNKRPRDKERGEDYRTFRIEPARGTEALLNALVRNVQARQQLVKAALEDMEEDEPLKFVGSAQMRDGVEALVNSMRQTLGVSIEQFRSHNTVTEAFAALRSAAEKVGVFVLLMGNLGTHHTDIDSRVFRGFALTDRIAPFIVINEKDSRAAWSFTMLHELAHVWLGQTEISGYESDADVEKFCDAVAARFLIAPAELEEIGVRNIVDIDDLSARVGVFAAARNLSRKMVAYNLLRSNLITAAVYQRLSSAFDAERLAREEEQERGEGGPNYYVVRRHRIGPGLVSLVRRSVATGALSVPKAGAVLGVKATAVDHLVGGGRAA